MLLLLLLAFSGSGWEVEGGGWAQTPSSVSLAEEGVRSEERGLGTQVWKI